MATEEQQDAIELLTLELSAFGDLSDGQKDAIQTVLDYIAELEARLNTQSFVINKSTKTLYSYSYQAIKPLPVGCSTTLGVGYCSADTEEEAYQIAMVACKKASNESIGFFNHTAQVIEIPPSELAKIGYTRQP